MCIGFTVHKMCVIIFLNDIHKNLRSSEGLWLFSYMASQDKKQLSKASLQLKAHSPVNKTDIKQRGIMQDNWH